MQVSGRSSRPLVALALLVGTACSSTVGIGTESAAPGPAQHQGILSSKTALPLLPAPASAAAATADGRDMVTGSLIHTWAYSDQPYCVILAKPSVHVYVQQLSPCILCQPSCSHQPLALTTWSPPEQLLRPGVPGTLSD